MNKKVSLTGIKPTGIPHLGNYLGAIKPAIDLANNYSARYFIADYHALNLIKNPEEIGFYTYEIAATWLACGLDPETMLFYKQSSIPEIFELSNMLMSFTAKGLMNRAHSYKASIANNIENDKDPDFGINMGLFVYPVLMAADILLFDTDIVPIGKDQKQHIEMAVDIAETFNHNYKKPLLKIPEPKIGENTDIILGLDGQKMSKSYNNTIPLFLPEKKLRKIVMKIKTNSQTVEEPKSYDECIIFSIYKLFSTEEQQNALKNRYTAGGMGWGHAKQELFEVLNEYLNPLREKYNQFINDKPYIDEVLKKGAEKAREISTKKIADLRQAIGIK